MKLADFIIKLALDSSKFHKGTEDAKMDVKSLVKQLDGSFDGLKNFGMDVLKRFAVPAAALGLGKFFLDSAHGAAELKREAQELDTTVGVVKSLHKASTLTRAPFEDVKTGLHHTRKSQSEALQGDKGKIDDFARLGITIKDLQNLNAEELFLKIADGVEKGSINAANFSSFLAIMGKQADALFPAFKEGFAGIANGYKSAIGTQLINALDEADKGWVKGKASVGGFFSYLKTQVAGGMLSLGKFTGAASSLIVAGFGIRSREEVKRAVSALSDRELMNDPAYGESFDVSTKLQKRLDNKIGIKSEKKKSEADKKAEQQKKDDEEGYKLRDQNDKKLAEMRVNALPKSAKEYALKKKSDSLQKKLNVTSDILEREKIKSQIFDAEQSLAGMKPDQKNLIQARVGDNLTRQGLFNGPSESIVQQAAVEQVSILRLQLNESRRTVQRLEQLNRNLTSLE